MNPNDQSMTSGIEMTSPDRPAQTSMKAGNGNRRRTTSGRLAIKPQTISAGWGFPLEQLAQHQQSECGGQCRIAVADG